MVAHIYPTFQGFNKRLRHGIKHLKRLGEDQFYRGCFDRTLDRCFENSDGDAMVFCLMAAAETDPILLMGIKRFCGNGKALEQWLNCYEKGKVYQGELYGS
jgi:hypothetical protein